jgi:murein DD-endopeptidase MepM/ murein hydrolase activator NlpD
MAYTPHQKAMIALARRLSANDTPKVQRALLEAMAVESNFRHLNYGDRDSVGVLQQRPSQGWGPASETPAQDINQFLQRARRNAKGFRGTAGQLAQSVQRSAFPERYDQRLNQANELLRGAVPKGAAGTLGKAPGGHSPIAQLAGASTQSMLAAQMLHQATQTAGGQLGDPSSVMAMAMMRQQAEAAAQEFGPTPQAGVPLSKPGKAGLPLGTPMGGRSEFGVVDAEGAPGAGGKRYHAGKDWFAPAGSNVTAPWGGKVVEVKQSRGNSGQVFGGTVKIQGADGRVFVARHVDPRKFKVGQSVKPGQAVATVSAWTGGSPHAHIEVWKSLRGGYRYENMIDPVRVFGGGG